MRPEAISSDGCPPRVDGEFDYDQAFSRNIGWVTQGEQQLLRKARVAVAGLGGVGGAHVLTLSRLGIGSFHIADFDEFSVQNLNRQAGAFISTLGQAKAQVIARLAADVNPTVNIVSFPRGVQADNLGAFLDGVDVYVDGIDFFAMPARRAVFAACWERGIPALTAAPLGMGVAFLAFLRGGMSFEDYFRLDGCDETEQFARFIAGLSPAMLQRGYLADESSVDFVARRGPSTAMACELCAGVMGTEVLKVLLRRGRVRPAPWSMQFDAFRQRVKWAWRPLGNANPLQQLLLMLIRPRLRRSPARQ